MVRGVVCIHSIINSGKCQDEKLNAEIESKWTPKKYYSEWLSGSYERLHFDSKAENVKKCGSFLEFHKPLSGDGVPPALAVADAPPAEGWKLKNAIFCRDRLCPLCQWRKSLKVFSQISKIMDNIENEFSFIFLTLTVPNCEGKELSKTIDLMQKSWNRFVGYKKFKIAVNGYFRALEITRNKEKGTFHPHFHIILAVDLDYFESDKYISQDEFCKMWQKALKVPFKPICDVRKVKPKDEITKGEKGVKSQGSAVAEIAKYSVKTSAYINKADQKTRDSIVYYLSTALSGRRLCSFGGIIEDVRKALDLDDYEDGDLIHVDGKEIRSDVAYMIRRYGWSCGNYKLVDECIEVNNE